MHIYTYQGVEYTTKEMADIAGISVRLFNSRVQQCGWSVDDAVSGERSHLSAKEAKRKPKGRKLHCVATCQARCNSK